MDSFCKGSLLDHCLKYLIFDVVWLPRYQMVLNTEGAWLVQSGRVISFIYDRIEA